MPIGGLLDHEFLLIATLLVIGYFVGSLLRLFAPDEVDEESSERLEKEWRNQHDWEEVKEKYEGWREELVNGNDIVIKEDGFDGWLFRVEDFPYPAWQNRKWQACGFDEVLRFYRDNYRNNMWPATRTSPKTFFNYCKLAVISNDGSLADEVNTAEGFTRYCAGTVVALGISIWLLAGSLVVQLILGALAFASSWGIRLAPSVDWKSQVLNLVLALILILALQRIRQRMVSSFRRVRIKEVETAYHAFYLYSTHSDEMVKKTRKRR